MRKYKQREYHGLRAHHLYTVWCNMIDRCYKKTHKDWRYYGGKGVKIYSEWFHSFQAFYDWSMGSGWMKGLVLDRIEGNGDYEPMNCRYTTIAENNINRDIMKNNKSGYKGVSKCGKRWRANLHRNKKTLHIGVYDTPQEANQARLDYLSNIHEDK